MYLRSTWTGAGVIGKRRNVDGSALIVSDRTAESGFETETGGVASEPGSTSATSDSDESSEPKGSLSGVASGGVDSIGRSSSGTPKARSSQIQRETDSS